LTTASRSATRSGSTWVAASKGSAPDPGVASASGISRQTAAPSTARLRLGTPLAPHGRTARVRPPKPEDLAAAQRRSERESCKPPGERPPRDLGRFGRLLEQTVGIQERRDLLLAEHRRVRRRTDSGSSRPTGLTVVRRRRRAYSNIADKVRKWLRLSWRGGRRPRRASRRLLAGGPARARGRTRRRPQGPG
jgi:hypothetical protein